ncbi:S8 family serine peptidase, partial [Candidatus Woesearchaeota archaeon]|nr:S8 family serine peptidase [Candidatus Woesearchaeota archaeon]
MHKWVFLTVFILISSAYAQPPTQHLPDPGSLTINNVGIPFGSQERIYDVAISIATLKDSYTVGEKIELTDPPDAYSLDERDENDISDGIYGDNPIYTERGIVIDKSAVMEKLYPEQIPGSSQNEPRYDGYIIEFREKPVLEKKVELEEKAKENQQTSSSLGKVPVVGGILRSVYTTFSLQEEDIPDRLESHSEKISGEHEQAKQKILSALGKKGFAYEITGSAIGAQEDSLEDMGEYKTVFNGIALDINDEEALKLRGIPEVKEVYPNYEVHTTLMDSVPLINADDVWLLDKDGGNCASSGKECLTGKGVTIAVIDTGVDYTHPDLGGCFGESCKVIGGYDFVNNDNDPMDDHGHGTHVAAIAAGNGVLKGVAPDARIVAYKVLNSLGSGSYDDVIKGVERAIDQNSDGDFSDHVDIISMSLGGPGDPDDPLSQAVDNVVNNGVVAVIAAGNSGPGKQTIGSPGTARKAITVGAIDKRGNIAIFSSRGPVIWNDENEDKKAIMKPDVVAPGVNICAAEYDSAWGDRKCLDDKHVSISGTSMATPHVAGAVALIKQAHPGWTPEEIKAVLKTTAVDIGKSSTVQGTGKIDVLESVKIQEKPLIAELESLDYTLSEEVDITGTAKGENFEKYEVYY